MTPSTGPAVSVVIPCHNAAAFLHDTLASVLSQSCGDLEIVLVDDGSTDDPAAIVQAIGDSRIRVLRTQASGGPSRPRNVGIGESRGRIIFFCDADDVMLPGKIERQVRMLETNPSLALVFTNFRIIDGDGRPLEADFLAGYRTFAEIRRLGPTAAGGLPREALYLGLLRANFIGTSSVAVRREVLQEVGMFDPGLASAEDIDLWLRIARSYDCGYLDMIGHAYRRHAQSVMRQFEARHPLARIAVILRHMPHVTDRRTLRAMRQRLAGNYSSLGYIWQVRGDSGLARRNYFQSLRTAPNWAALRGLVKCLLGSWSSNRRENPSEPPS